MATNQYTQEHRRIALETPLGQDALMLTAFRGREEISGLFHFELEMLSLEDTIDPAAIVGKNVTFLVRDEEGDDEDNEGGDDHENVRFFNGFVKRFVYCGRTERLSMYRAEVVPWLWFLTRVRDCRIFQDMSALEIIEAVFADCGFDDYDITGIQSADEIVKRSYCVQYRESSFDFVSRLMEEEGIFYYFKHENGKHTLMLANHRSAYQQCRNTDLEIAESVSGLDSFERVLTWEHLYEYCSGRSARNSFDFEQPSTDLKTEIDSLIKLDNIDKFELYDYLGDYVEASRGEALTRIHMEREESRHDVVKGSTVCCDFSPGFAFRLAKHYNPSEEGREFVITAVEHKAVEHSYQTSASDVDRIYENTFTCIPVEVTFRPASRTEKPRLQGAQTAIVVGPDGEEVYTDEYGRVKVQFHWDRYAHGDENSSCWIRVSHGWAGKKWGMFHLPRIGQEVVVDFLEGDPDQPIITGSVYNGEQEPPYALPENKTISTLKSNSTKDASGFNEIRFEDKKDEEQIFVHAQKNLDMRVLNDRYETIEHDRHLEVENDKFEHVKNDRHETVDHDHAEEVKNDRSLKVGGKDAVEIDGSKSLTVHGNVIESFKADHSEKVLGDYYLKATNIVIEATSNVTLKVGQSYIAIESGGIKIATSGSLELDGMQVTQKAKTQMSIQGLQTGVDGQAMLTLKGGLVKIN